MGGGADGRRCRRVAGEGCRRTVAPPLRLLARPLRLLFGASGAAISGAAIPGATTSGGTMEVRRGPDGPGMASAGRRWGVILLAVLSTGLVAWGANLTAGRAGAAVPATSPAPGAYQNPLTPDDAPDPDIVSANGTYYAFTTGGTFGHIQELQSTDLADWTPVPSPGPLAVEPTWV